MKIGVAPLTATSNDLPANVLLVVPLTLFSSGLKVLVPKRGMLLLKQINKQTTTKPTTLIPLIRRLKLPPRNTGLFLYMSQQVKKGVIIWD